jgi:molybdopterin converting factor small subunit
MQVTIHYVAQLRRAADCASERLEVEAGLTVGELFGKLAAVHDQAFRALLLDENGRPRPALLTFVGGEPAAMADELHQSDEITILTPMAGGQSSPFPFDASGKRFGKIL